MRPKACYTALCEPGNRTKVADEAAWRVSIWDEDLGEFRASTMTFPRQREAQMAADFLYAAGVTDCFLMDKLIRELKAKGLTARQFVAQSYQWWITRRTKPMSRDSVPCKSVPHDCGDCGQSFLTDIYVTTWGIICGDCRYVRRHGRPPPRGSLSGAGTPYSATSSGRYHGSETVHLNNRFDNMTVSSVAHAQCLGGIISDSQQSIR